MKAVFFVILLAIPVLLMGLTYHNVHAEQLKVLESQLNKDSITGVLQNPYNYTIDNIQVRAEFYDKEDGHLVGLRDFGYVFKDELEPGEKVTYKVWEHAGETQEFPKTDFIVKAEGLKMDNTEYNDGEVLSFDEQISKIKNYTKALKDLEDAATHVTELENGTHVITNVTEIPKDNINED